MVRVQRFELWASWSQITRATNCATPGYNGAIYGIWTRDSTLARSRVATTPILHMVVPMRIERMTPALSARCSNHLSYGTILKQDTIDLRRSTIELIPYIRAFYRPLIAHLLPPCQVNFGRGWRESNPHFRLGMQSKLLLMSLTYINIIT